MACVDFPSTGLVPNVTTFEVDNVIYLWTGIAWESQVSGGGDSGIKMDKRLGAPEDNIVVFDDSGNSKDSGASISSLTGSGGVAFNTINDALNSINLLPLTTAIISDTLAGVAGYGGQGGSLWKVVPTSSVTPNGFNIRESIADPTLSLVYQQTDSPKVADYSMTVDAIDGLLNSLDTGSTEITGGEAQFPIGRKVYDKALFISAEPANKFICKKLSGYGKQSSVMDFTNAVGTNGIEFEEGFFYEIDGLSAWRADLDGLVFHGAGSSGGSNSVNAHTKASNLRSHQNGGNGMTHHRGFMSTLNQLWLTNNGGYGYESTGDVHTSVFQYNNYADGNVSGYKINGYSYSSLNSCASDNSIQHGYVVNATHTTTFTGCGAEASGRAGWYQLAGENSTGTIYGKSLNVQYNSIFGFGNGSDGGGFGGLLHLRGYQDGIQRENSATLFNSWGRDTDSASYDVVVDGEGSYLVEGYNTLDSGVISKNEGYIQHVPKVFIKRNIIVTNQTELCNLISAQGHDKHYNGELLIGVGNVSPDSLSASRNACYKLLVSVGESSDNDSLTVLGATGLNENTGNGFPNFEFSIIGNTLYVDIGATGSPSAAQNWWFEVYATGFMKIQEITHGYTPR